MCGSVKIGKLCLIGANSVVLPNLKVGDNTIIGAGAIVIKYTSKFNCIWKLTKNYKKMKYDFTVIGAGIVGLLQL